MAGKFINELSSNPPAPEDLVVFFDKSKAVTVQAPLSDVVGAGLNLSAATKGQTAVVDTKVDPISLETIPFLKWEKAGIDFGSTTTKPSAGTDEIITHDPVSGTNGKTTLAELIKSVLPPVTGADAGKQLTVDINGVAGWTADSSDLPAFTLADAKKQLTVNDAGDAVIWKADPNELPAPSLADAGKSLLVKSDGTGPEWGSPLPDITAGLTALQTKADKSGVEWVASVNQATNLKGGFTAGAFFPVNDTKADTTRFVDAPTYRHLVGVPEGYTFDIWTPNNRQIEEYYPEFQLAQTRMSAEALATFGSAPMTKADVAGFPGQYKYSSAIQASNGKVFLIPWEATKVAYCQQDGTGYTEFGGALTGIGLGGYASAILLGDRRILCVPSCADNLLLIDPDALTVKQVPGLGTSQYKFTSATLLPDGKVLIAPAAAAKFKLFDPQTDTLTDIGPDYGTSSSKFGSAQLLPNGKVFVVPSSKAGAVLFDPVTSAFSDIPGGHTGHYSACLLPDGRVLIPGTLARFYDYAQNTITDASISLNGIAQILPNGRVMVWDNLRVQIPKIYRTDTNTVADLPFTISANAYNASVLLRNGNVFLAPFAATSAGIVSSGFGKDIPLNYSTSPFYCKTI